MEETIPLRKKNPSTSPPHSQFLSEENNEDDDDNKEDEEGGADAKRGQIQLKRRRRY